jgi:hypothetical protein
MQERGSEGTRWELVDELPDSMSPSEHASVERAFAFSWDGKVRGAAKSDMVILVDFRSGSWPFKMVPRRGAAAISQTFRELPARFTGELWAAWLVAADDCTQLILRLSVQRPCRSGAA